MNDQLSAPENIYLGVSNYLFIQIIKPKSKIIL